MIYFIVLISIVSSSTGVLRCLNVLKSLGFIRNGQVCNINVCLGGSLDEDGVLLPLARCEDCLGCDDEFFV